MTEPQPVTPGPPNRRRFLQITAVGAGAAGLAGASLAGVGPAAVTSGLTSLTHPGVLHSRADLDRMRAKVAVGAEPWLNGYNVFKNDFFSRSSYTVAEGRATVTRDPAGDPGNAELWYDCNAAYQNALMWCITRDTAHATKALTIIKSWTDALEEINGKDAELAAGIYGAKLAAAVEIMHYTGPAGSWTATELADTVAMLENVFVPLINIYGDGAYGLMGLKGMMRIAVACNNLTLFDHAYNAFMTHSCCGLTRLIQSGTGQCCESGRTQGVRPADPRLARRDLPDRLDPGPRPVRRFPFPAAVGLRVHGQVQPRQHRAVRRRVRAVRLALVEHLRRWARHVPQHLRDRPQPLCEARIV